MLTVSSLIGSRYEPQEAVTIDIHSHHQREALELRVHKRLSKKSPNSKLIVTPLIIHHKHTLHPPICNTHRKPPHPLGPYIPFMLHQLNSFLTPSLVDSINGSRIREWVNAQEKHRCHLSWMEQWDELVFGHFLKNRYQYAEYSVIVKEIGLNETKGMRIRRNYSCF